MATQQKQTGQKDGAVAQPQAQPRAQPQAQPQAQPTLSRKQLAALLNEDLAREYQAIVAYVIYSQVLKGAEYMKIAEELENHAKEELDHALRISRQIDYLGEMPTN